MMDCEVKEYFSILLEACHVEEISLDVAYRQLRELLERLCRTQMSDGSLQMTDLSARISFVASKVGLFHRGTEPSAYLPADLQCYSEPPGENAT